jgi:hypothetical protein
MHDQRYQEEQNTLFHRFHDYRVYVAFLLKLIGDGNYLDSYRQAWCTIIFSIKTEAVPLWKQRAESHTESIDISSFTPYYCLPTPMGLNFAATDLSLY